MDHNLNISLERTKSVTFFYNKVRNKNTPHKCYRQDMRKKQISCPFSFPLPTSTLFFYFHAFFFLLFVGVLQPDQPFWPFYYASVYLPPCCTVHILHGCCCCLLVVFFTLNKSFLFYRSALIDDLWDES
jgi:ABC-type polysaccharide/polyol phosphate export permease